MATGSIDGQQLPYAPHFSGTLAADWEASQVSAAKVVVHVDTNYDSKEYLALPNEDAIAQGRYSLLNARLSLQSGDDKWEVGIWDRNIADKFYLTNAVDVRASVSTIASRAYRVCSAFDAQLPFLTAAGHGLEAYAPDRTDTGRVSCRAPAIGRCCIEPWTAC